MATLTNTKIKDTYDGLLKTTNNEAIGASGVTLIEDGLGNASALSVGRSGNGVTITGNLAVDTNTLYVDAANNRVGIGTTSPDTLIEASSAVGTSASLLKLRNSSVASANNIGLIDFEFDNSFSGQNVDVQIGAIKTNSGNEESAFIVKTTSGTGTPEERIRIDASGNVGIGVSNAETKLDIDGFLTLRNAPYPSPTSSVLKDGFIGSDDGTLKFAINGASNAAYGSMAFITRKGDSSDPIEAMRITSSGSVSIGTTTVNSSGLTIEKSGNHLFLRATSAPSGEYWNFDINSNNKLSVLNDNNIGVGINDGDSSWSSVSDESIKENIVELSGVLDKVDSYRCVEYNLIGNDKKKIGFIAQDWQQDFPAIVDADEDGILSMKYTETIPVLLKAIQELRAEIELLKNK